MAPFYKTVVEELQAPFDEGLYDTMVAKNEEELKKFDEKATDAEQNQGETEVNEAFLSKADYYAEIGDKVRSVVYMRKPLQHFNRVNILGKCSYCLREFVEEINHFRYSYRYRLHLCTYRFLLW